MRCSCGAPSEDSARAHVLVVEALSGRPDMFQTLTAEAQDLERQIQRVWAAYRRAPEAHRNAWALRSRLDAITAEMAQQPLSFDEWQVVYRQVLQLERALAGKPQLLEERLLGKDPVMATSMAPTPDTAAPADNPRSARRRWHSRAASSRSARSSSTKKWSWRAPSLPRTSTPRSAWSKLFGAAALLALFALNLVLLALVLALAAWLPLPGWTVALGLGTLLLALAAVLGGGGIDRRAGALDLTPKDGQGGHALGEGTTRVVEATESGYPASPRSERRFPGCEISSTAWSPNSIGASTLCRNWTRRRPARKAGGVALALAVMAAAWMLAPRLTARYWPRRSRRG